MLEDKLLIWKLNKGQPEVLHTIYTKYKDELMTLAFALLHDRHAAEDVLHDVFVALIRNCGRLRLTHNLKGYLVTAVANQARNRTKTKRHQGASLDTIANYTSNHPGPDSVVILSERAQRLTNALTQLPDVQREVLTLHLYSALSFKAISHIQEVSINTVHGRYRYGVTKLRSILAKKEIS